MDLDTKLSSSDLLEELHFAEVTAEEDELSRLKELYHFADFGRLSAGLFHDLATPLNIVLLNLEEMKEKCDAIDDKEIAELRMSIDRAFHGTERMMRFLQLAREHVQQKKVLSMFSVNQEIRQAIEMISQTTAPKKISILFEEKDNVQLFGNSTQLFQVILNLLSNSRDAYEVSAEKKISVSLRQHAQGIQIAVQDWGSGISKADQSNVFKPFFTTKAANKGSGIGLFISKDVIEKQFKGTLTFQSTQGSGTTFTIDLPRRGSLRVSEANGG